jgi:hypothetical protein
VYYYRHHRATDWRLRLLAIHGTAAHVDADGKPVVTIDQASPEVLAEQAQLQVTISIQNSV